MSRSKKQDTVVKGKLPWKTIPDDLIKQLSNAKKGKSVTAKNAALDRAIAVLHEFGPHYVEGVIRDLICVQKRIQCMDRTDHTT